MMHSRLDACLSCNSFRAQMLASARATLKNTADAEDLIQQIALEALQKSQRTGRIDNPESWLWHFYRFAHRDLVRERRRRYRRFGIPLSEHVSAQDVECELIEKQERATQMSGLFVRFRKLTARQQQVIRMLYAEERNGKQIAAALGITYKAFRAAKDEALARLRRER